MAKGTADAALLAAIEGYQSEHKGSKQHEDMISQLKRVQDQVSGRSAAPGASPGKRAALKAGGEDTMTSESREPAGDNKQSNEPAEPNIPDKVAAMFGKDGRDDRMKGTEAVRSGGITVSNLPSEGLAPGTAEIRRIVADRERSRPDTKMKSDPHKPGDDNKQSQPAGEGYPPAKRVGDVTGASLKGGSATEVKGFGTQAKSVAETQVPDGVGHDPWATASAQAKKRLLASRK